MISAVSDPSGHPGGNDTPAEASVDLEIRVGGKKQWIRQKLGQADETGIGNAHRDVRILVQQIENWNEVVHVRRQNPQGSATTGVPECRTTFWSEQMIGLG
jgi:hypothetical protein